MRLGSFGACSVSTLLNYPQSSASTSRMHWRRVSRRLTRVGMTLILPRQGDEAIGNRSLTASYADAELRGVSRLRKRPGRPMGSCNARPAARGRSSEISAVYAHENWALGEGVPFAGHRREVSAVRMSVRCSSSRVSSCY